MPISSLYKWAMLACVALVSVCSSIVKADQPSTPSIADRNLEAFDMVWSRVRDTHWDKTLGGLDWEACKAEFRPSLEEAQDIGKVRLAMAKLLAKLGQSHFVVIPAEAYRAEDQSLLPSGWSGIHALWLDGDALVIRVDRESPASKSGLLPGMTISQIDNVSVAELVSIDSAESLPPKEINALVNARLAQKLGGTIGQPKTVTTTSIDDSVQTFQFILDDHPGEKSQFGNLPALPVSIHTEMLPDNIGYIQLGIFLDPSRVIPTIGDFVTAHADAKGMIIDLRGNMGGMGAMAGGIAGWFSTEKISSLGTMNTRDSQLKFIAFQQRAFFQGPLAILVDQGSMSTSEIFAEGLQAIGRAEIFGQPTPGAALPSMIELLPNGDRFLHAFANYVNPKGVAFEGKGVQPDHLVPLDRFSLSNSPDSVLQSAVTWLRDHKETQQSTQQQDQTSPDE